MSRWEPVIGLEVHVQLRTASKTFSGSAAAYGAEPNALTDPVVLALPGALPVLNERAVEFAVRLGLACGCSIRRRSRLARKHYFYPDLPKGYQISQYDEPLCEGGGVDVVVDGRVHRVRLTRIHLEEDAGKSLHDGGAASRVDLNRAGVPLCEIVSEPEIRSAAHAAAYMRAIRQLVRYLDISDGNMEEGSLRCDANVSVRLAGSEELGVRVELKNINSFRFVQKALDYEIARQVRVLDGGGQVVQETRLWDADAGVTRPMRGKEEAEDYRYFPDPDLPPLVVDDALLARARAAIPELPAARRARYIDQLGLGPADADAMAEERDVADYFDAVVAAGAPPKAAANWIQGDLTAALHRAGRSVADCPVSPAHLAELIGLLEDDAISGPIAKRVLARAFATGESPVAIVERDGLRQISDAGAIEAIARDIVAAHPDQVAAYRAGKTKLLGYFVGQVMKATGGKANPAAVNDVLKRLLDEAGA
ncbi:MAG: Asp-tRNA(Asn)/Glu-tRNA(Gln) amidotransferase subunit GatB [Deltaproteobacteria bacterium]|nr:MAG: Asp-tRNA(Asn)/Glu-tRNA(Gln) amidotransferase subunit GatB [Deltaproteobacteria bacterium]